MGRRVTVGILPGGIGQLSIDQNAITTVDTNASLTITADGTGIIRVLKDFNAVSGNIVLENQHEIRFRELTTSGSNYISVKAPATLTDDYTLTLPAAVAARDKSVLTSDTNGNTSWEPAKAFEYSTQSTSFSAVSFGGYFVNTSSGGVTATLPSSPTVGDTVRFLDIAKTFDTNNFTVARNGKLIQGDASNLTVDSESAAFELIFSGDTYGWRIFSI